MPKKKNKSMNISDRITAEYIEDEDRVNIMLDGETVRTVSPQHRKTYKFTVEGEEYYFLYEEFTTRGTFYRQVYLFPLNEFKNNKIEL